MSKNAQKVVFGNFLNSRLRICMKKLQLPVLVPDRNKQLVNVPNLSFKDKTKILLSLRNVRPALWICLLNFGYERHDMIFNLSLFLSLRGRKLLSSVT